VSAARPSAALPARTVRAYAIAPTATGGGLVGGAGGQGAIGPTTTGSGASGSAAPIGGMGASSGVGTPAMAILPPGAMPSPAWLTDGHAQYLMLPAPPIGMSRDGTTVLGVDGLLWESWIMSPPFLVPSFPSPRALSSDGTTVVGDGTGASACPTPMRWTQSGGVQTLDQPPASMAFVNGNGTFAAGTAWIGNDCSPVAQKWALLWQTFSAQPVQLGNVQNSEALGLSDTGVTMIGHAWNSAAPIGSLFSYSPARGLSNLGPPPGWVTTAVFTSADASAFAGTARDGSDNAFAFTWTAASGFTTLPKVPGRGQSLAFGLSSDGTVVAGLGTNGPAGPPFSAAQDGVPFMWTAAKGLLQLPGPTPAATFESVVMTPDASSIIGNLTPNTGASPSRWDQNGKPYNLLPDSPMFLGTCHPVVTHISADGRTIAGACDSSARKTGFVARIWIAPPIKLFGRPIGQVVQTGCPSRSTCGVSAGLWVGTAVALCRGQGDQP
jgi:uncharacterized membrane protein